MADPDSLFICRLDELHAGDSRGFILRQGGQSHGIFLVRQADRVYGYVNRCPHTGAPLDWVPHRFLSLDGRYIQCAMHAAMFRIEDGACLGGPCNGTGLSSLPLVIENGLVRLPGGYRLPVPR
jgi:nitrite reductase/ring-hydroxylating ferredoxin subunit